jgi:hypothetical protein
VAGFENNPENRPGVDGSNVGNAPKKEIAFTDG